jgi:hypothetical protein
VARTAVLGRLIAYSFSVGIIRFLLFAGLLAFAITQYRAIRRRARHQLSGNSKPVRRKAANEPIDWRAGMASPIADNDLTAQLYAEIPDATDVRNEIVAPRSAPVDGIFVSVFDHRRQWRAGGTDHARALSCARFETAASVPHLVLRAKDADDGTWADLHPFAADATDLARAFDVMTADDEFASLLLERPLIDYLLSEPRLRLFCAQGDEVLVAFDALHLYIGLQAASSDRGDDLARFAAGIESRIPPVLRVRYPR